MPNLLSQLLAAEEPLFSLAIKDLERASGNTGMDVRLISEIIGKTHLKARELNLDSTDTTGREMYHALLNKIQGHDQQLVKLIGGNDPEDVQILLPLIKKAVDKMNTPKDTWVLKRSVAKRLLQENPPKNVMKRLGYSSIESLTKRENLGEIYGALRFVESPSWLRKFNTNYKSLTASDFEIRPIEILVMDSKRWGDMAEHFVIKKRHNITHVKELGTILLLPTKLKKLKGIAITDLPLVLHYISEIRLYSAYFKLQQVKPHFGKIIAETLNNDIHSAAVMAGNHIHWRVIHKYYGRSESKQHPEIFEPHVQPEDLEWRRAEELLIERDPALGFWRDLDYVGVIASGQPVSFNLMDVAVNYCTGAPYEKRVFYHMRESLWNELFIRYMGHEALEKQILQQLNGSMIKPERLRV